jgi:hypothetical protein
MEEQRVKETFASRPRVFERRITHRMMAMGGIGAGGVFCLLDRAFPTLNVIARAPQRAS